MVYKDELPVLVRIILLPYNGRIVYDSLFQRSTIIFDPEAKRSFKEIYLEARIDGRIYTNLEDYYDQKHKSREEDHQDLK